MRLIRPSVCSIVPPYVLENIARQGSPRQRAVAVRSLGLDVVHRARSTVTVPAERPVAGDGLQRTVSSAGGTESLPGRPVRSEGDEPSSDVAVDEAYDGLGATYDLYLDA
jgi:hypothetical protein